MTTHVRRDGVECSPEHAANDYSWHNVEVQCSCGEWCRVVQGDAAYEQDNGDWTDDSPDFILCEKCNKYLGEWGMGIAFADTIERFRAMSPGEWESS